MIVVLALWPAYAVFKKKPVIGAILVAVIMLTFTNYEQYISMFMGGGSIFESLGEDLQLSVTTYYRGGRYLGVHHYVTLAVQAALVVLLFVRGGGYRSIYSTPNWSGFRTGYYNTTTYQSVPDCFHCSGIQSAGVTYI